MNMCLTFVDIIFIANFKYLFSTHLGARTVSQKFLEKYPSKCHFDFKFGFSIPELYKKE